MQRNILFSCMLSFFNYQCYKKTPLLFKMQLCWLVSFLSHPLLCPQGHSPPPLKKGRKRLKRQTWTNPTQQFITSTLSMHCIKSLWFMICVLLSLQEYEERLAKLQAEYNAEQESKAKLQEDIAALRSSYESKLSSLEKAQVSRGSSVPKNGNSTSCANNRTKVFRCWILPMYASLYCAASLH